MLTKANTSLIPLDQVQTDLRQACGEFTTYPFGRRDVVTGGVGLERRGRLDIARVSLDIDRVSRDRDGIRRDDGEHFFLILQEKGKARMLQDGEGPELSPGDMIIIDSTRTSDFVFSGDFSHQISLHLPRTEMVSRFGHQLTGGTMLYRADPLSIAMHAVMAKLFAGDPDSPVNHHLGEALFGLIGSVLAEREGRADTAFSSSLVQADKYIEQNYADPDLTIAGMASDLGLTTRQLQRLFASTGDTPSKRLLQRRLDHARDQLIARANGQRHDLISTIAFEAGFNDLSYFNRAFRRAFGCSPGAFAIRLN
ncbi:helix-turn-helix domain-containing protein [Cucumibacter marinus]|uniref:helix-turn-helix domain-containing protein n=1 Tax=Cucumibacter marinus TaxID=1121252 RepID=UPI0003F8396B|nr:helix-turn-helix domain-containing protein [Cucumibacter marinus]